MNTRQHTLTRINQAQETSTHTNLKKHKQAHIRLTYTMFFVLCIIMLSIRCKKDWLAILRCACRQECDVASSLNKIFISSNFHFNSTYGLVLYSRILTCTVNVRRWNAIIPRTMTDSIQPLCLVREENAVGLEWTPGGKPADLQWCCLWRARDVNQINFSLVGHTRVKRMRLYKITQSTRNSSVRVVGSHFLLLWWYQTGKNRFNGPVIRG